jgi:CRP-like cAMP-binding protein
MNALSDRPRNRLLLALSSRNLKRLMPELEHIRCQREQVLMDADSSLDHVFFPESGVVSVVAVYADGSVIEMATIGREGCTGMQAFFGAKSSSVRLLVQIPGSAAKMSRVAFARAMESMPSFRHLMSAYIHAFLEQVLVSVACNGAHSLKEKLARWLLMMRDRSDDDALAITQSLLAEMLGVQRPTITHAVRELERAGAIEHGRRQVRIADRQRLIEESCECYQLVRARVAFHLPRHTHKKARSVRSLTDASLRRAHNGAGSLAAVVRRKKPSSQSNNRSPLRPGKCDGREAVQRTSPEPAARGPSPESLFAC